jgi:hypothetical protein
MYTFSDEMRRSYEGSPLSFVYYQNIDGTAVPVLASDGFCKNTGIDRSHVLEWLSAGLFERMHPDDVGTMKRISNDFLLQKGTYDVLFHCRLGSHYHIIHGSGKWHTMPDGTELAVIQYMDVTKAHERMMSVEEIYDLNGIFKGIS